MIQKGPCLVFCFFFFLCAAGYVNSQARESGARTGPAPLSPPASPAPLSPRLQEGVRLYSGGRWREAVIEFRRAQAEAPTAEQRGEALYWIAQAELSAGEYAASVRDMEELERIAPASPRRAEIPYHKGRAYYYLGRYDEAIVLLKDYLSRLGDNDNSRKSAALYWIGECLFSLGQLEGAREIFTLITEQYPQSAKFEASSYRLGLINQKKVEIELLALLKWSHEESLKTMEEYQRRERTYDQALTAYQKRIADMLKDTRLADLESANAEYRKQLAEAEERIMSLEENLKAASPPGIPPPPKTEAEKAIRLLDLKTRALELRGELENLRPAESGGNGGSK
ncbi:MAG: tetratricopeptide repeat protein [Treponema sp.]|jgi:TolA-binding protein|nr:tetratricopeptide repeat protein [Treponema sp.]